MKWKFYATNLVTTQIHENQCIGFNLEMLML
jgi:hypothetical protein